MRPSVIKRFKKDVADGALSNFKEHGGVVPFVFMLMDKKKEDDGYKIVTVPIQEMMENDNSKEQLSRALAALVKSENPHGVIFVSEVDIGSWDKSVIDAIGEKNIPRPSEDPNSKEAVILRYMSREGHTEMCTLYIEEKDSKRQIQEEVSWIKTEEGTGRFANLYGKNK